MAKPRLGSGVRFAALTKRITRNGNATDPAAVAAFIGRQKYGAKKFAKLATAGRKAKSGKGK